MREIGKILTLAYWHDMDNKPQENQKPREQKKTV